MTKTVNGLQECLLLRPNAPSCGTECQSVFNGDPVSAPNCDPPPRGEDRWGGAAAGPVCGLALRSFPRKSSPVAFLSLHDEKEFPQLEGKSNLATVSPF